MLRSQKVKGLESQEEKPVSMRTKPVKRVPQEAPLAKTGMAKLL